VEWTASEIHHSLEWDGQSVHDRDYVYILRVIERAVRGQANPVQVYRQNDVMVCKTMYDDYNLEAYKALNWREVPVLIFLA
jgi:hypothetical protein